MQHCSHPPLYCVCSQYKACDGEQSSLSTVFLFDAMIYFIFTVCGLVFLTQSIEIVFESFEQISGYELFETTVRIRKYNRTTNVMNGTTFLKFEVNDTLVVSSSSLEKVSLRMLVAHSFPTFYGRLPRICGTAASEISSSITTP